MCQNLFVQVMADWLEKSIKRQAKMLRAIEVPTNDFLKAKEAFLLDTDEVRTLREKPTKLEVQGFFSALFRQGQTSTCPKI